MFYFKNVGVEGGDTVFPQLGIRISCSNNGLVIFDGRRYQHYVEEIQNATHEDWNRCSLVLSTTYFSPRSHKATLKQLEIERMRLDLLRRVDDDEEFNRMRKLLEEHERESKPQQPQPQQLQIQPPRRQQPKRQKRKRECETDVDVEPQKERLIDSESSEEEYEVERIVDSRRIGKRGKLEYKVFWKGYSENDCSWEPLSQLQNAMDAVKDYEESCRQ